MKPINVDAYIQSSADFAKPILRSIRQSVLKYCPDATETLKWGFPHFIYKDRILCSMAAFSHHCAFGFWLGNLMDDPDGVLEQKENRNAMGHLGRISSLSDLPSATVMKRLIRQAMKLTDEGATPARNAPKKMPLPEIPVDLQTELKTNKKAGQFFRSLPPSHQKEYLQWILEAKRDETRQKRIHTTIEWLAEGKSRNWKYESKK